MTVDGSHLPLLAGSSRATVCTRGAALVQLTVGGVDAVVPGPPGPCRPEEYRGVVLAPWPNRTEPRYVFDDRALELPVDEPATGAALHGLVHDRDWAVVTASTGTAVLETTLGEDPGYPFPLHLTAGFELNPGRLDATIRARNTGDGDAPVGLGVHPYLSAGVPVDRTTLDLPASRVLVLGPRGLPEAPPRSVAGTSLDLRGGRPLDGLELDHAFTDLARDQDGRVAATLSGGDRTVVLRAGPTAGWLMAFTSDTLPAPSRRAAVAIEPMTCPPGALATGEGLAVLSPGEELQLAWSIHVAG